MFARRFELIQYQQGLFGGKLRSRSIRYLPPALHLDLAVVWADLYCTDAAPALGEHQHILVVLHLGQVGTAEQAITGFGRRRDRHPQGHDGHQNGGSQCFHRCVLPLGVVGLHKATTDVKARG